MLPVADDVALVTTGTKADVRVSAIGDRGWLVDRPVESDDAELSLITQTMKHLAPRHAAWLLRKYKVDCVLDVGANKGQYAKELRKNGYTGDIVSFEPVPRFVKALEKAAARDDRWTVRQLALGRSEGTVPIHVQRTFSSLLPSSEYGKNRFSVLREHADVDQVDVPLRRLDVILDELLEPTRARGIENPRVFLKMDTQGFDLEVFGGLGDRAADIVGLQSEVALLLIYESMPRMPESVATYEAAGFEITGLYPVTREPDGRVIEYDCLMVRASAL
jgi:FkbM family methyltransferase